MLGKRDRLLRMMLVKVSGIAALFFVNRIKKDINLRDEKR